MWHKFLFLIPFFIFCSLGKGQYYSITLDTQQPASQPIIDRVFCGNNTYLRAFIFEDGAVVDLTPWAMTFRYGWGRDDTNGMVTINGTTSSNRVDFLGATNVYAQPFDSYYWSISGTHSSGYIKTFGTGTLRVFYDPSTSTNLIALMEQVNISWFTNFVGAQVESNRVRIAVFETNKVNLSAFNSTNVIFEGRITTNATNIAELQGRSNTWNGVTNKANETALVALSNQLLLADGVIQTNLLGVSNQLLLADGVIQTNLLAVSNQLVLVDGTLQTNINLSSNAWHTTHTTYVAQVQGATNDIISQLLLADGVIQTNLLSVSNQLVLVDGVLQTNINLSSNYFYTTHTAYVAQVQGATNDIISQLNTVETGKMSLATQMSTNTLLQNQITANLTNQNATNTLLQNAIDSVGTGTWSLALLTDGSRPASYINVVNTNYLGANIVTNGTFTGSASNWSLTTFYYQANRVILNPSLTGQIEYTNTLVLTTNKLYQLAVKTTYAGAAVTSSVGGVTSTWTSVNGDTHKDFFYAVNNNKPIISASTGTNSLELDDVTLKECPTGSLFVAQDVNAGNSVRARVGIYAPNITAISNDLDTAESDIAGLKTSTGTLNTAVGNLQTATNALNSNKLNLSGGIMTGPLTNNVAYYGNGVGLTNISASSTGLAWTAVSGTPTNYGVGGYGILDIPAAVTDHTVLTNLNGSNDFLHLTLAEKAIATNEVGQMYRYNALTNSGEQVVVLASGQGITASRTNETFYFNIPVGVHLVSSRLRIDGGETDSGVIRLSLGTNDMAMGSASTDWIPTGSAYNETSYASVVIVCRPDPDDLSLVKISGLGTQAGTYFSLRLSW